MTSKKHYVAVAKELDYLRQVFGDNEDSLLAVRSIAVGLANIYQDENPRFDRERFMQACGLED